MRKKAALLLTVLLVALSVLFADTALAHTATASGGASASTPDLGGGSAHASPMIQYVTISFAPDVECAITTDANYDCGPH